VSITLTTLVHRCKPDAKKKKAPTDRDAKANGGRVVALFLVSEKEGTLPSINLPQGRWRMEEKKKPPLTSPAPKASEGEERSV
jgi:hypothetical protein